MVGISIRDKEIKCPRVSGTRIFSGRARAGNRGRAKDGKPHIIFGANDSDRALGRRAGVLHGAWDLPGMEAKASRRLSELLLLARGNL